MIALDTFNKILEENDDRLPLLTLDEFFEGNTQEDSIDPNQYGYGRPPISEIWASELEALARCEWLCSDGAAEWKPSANKNFFCCIPSVPEGYHCCAIVWD